MALYPSLEDMQIDHMAQAERGAIFGGSSASPQQGAPQSASDVPSAAATHASFYPSLSDYMGLDLDSQAVVRQCQQLTQPTAPVANSPYNQVASVGGCQMVAPLSANVVAKTATNHAIREVTLCKDKNGLVGLRCQEINKGIFVVLVRKDSPAALAGLRFGDQILQVNGVTVAGFSMDKIHSLLRKASGAAIQMAVRDRPFERSITLHKDSAGITGFQLKNGKIVSLVKGSSAARNGLLTDHYVLEVNGRNVVSLKDSEVRAILSESGSVVVVTIMPAFVFDHMMSHVNPNLLKKMMDHTVPEL